MAAKLPPTPVGVPPGHSFWNDWYEKLRRLINETTTAFTALDFAGSNLTSIQTRNHNDLQNIQGGAPGDYQHLTTAQVAVIGGGPYQPLDSDLTALATNGSTGLWSITGAGTGAARTITGTANRIGVTNGGGVAGNPTLDIGTDVVTLTGSQTLTNKTINVPIIASPTINTAITINSSITQNGVQLNVFPGAATTYELVNRNGTGFDFYTNSGGVLGFRISSTGAITAAAGITHGSSTLLTTSVALTNGAAAAGGTLTNAPTAGNPTKWVPINDNGTTRYIPCW